MTAPTPSPEPTSDSAFATTRWSVLLRARGSDPAEARAALATLCESYWYPIYAYIRRHCGHDDEAQDLTQAFFAFVLESAAHASADAARGRFRTFLLTCCRNFLANERDRAAARKRGGNQTILPLDFAGAADRYSREPADRLSPERLFERRWALDLLERALGRLGQEYTDSGKGELQHRLLPGLTGDADAVAYAAIAAEVGMSEAAVKKAAQRLRQRYRELLREEIAATVDSPDQVDEEIRALFAALAP
jgi:RNA polymerase sigma-70 factor (ECF subfamily)